MLTLKRTDAYVTSVGNHFCCSEHFLPSDFKLSTAYCNRERYRLRFSLEQMMTRSPLFVEREDVKNLSLAKKK